MGLICKDVHKIYKKYKKKVYVHSCNVRYSTKEEIKEHQQK